MKAAPEVLDKALRAGWVAFLAAGNIDIVIAAAIDSLPEPSAAAMDEEIAKLKAENARLRDLLRQWYGFSDGEWTNKISLRYETHAVFAEKEKA